MIDFLRKHALLILILFHFIGWLGISFIDHSFANLSALNLLLSAFLLAICHIGNPKNFWFLFLALFVLGYLIELLGISTGFPFGEYEYGAALGPSLFGVPIIIGVNWFLLVMGSGFLAKKIIKSRRLQIIAASMLMVALDGLIEMAAPKLNFWYWEEQSAPLLNYFGWFAVALIMQCLFQKTVATHSNKLAIPYIVTVIVFFTLLNFTV